MRTVQRALMLIFYVSSAVCIVVNQTRLGSQAAHAVTETQPFSELRGTISPDAPDERYIGLQIIRGGTAQQPSFDTSAIFYLLARARTTGEVFELYSSMLLRNQSLLDQAGIRRLNTLFAAELDRRREQDIKSEVTGTVKEDRAIDWAVLASFIVAFASGFSALGIWFIGYFNRKNYLHTVAKDNATAFASAKMA